MDPTAGLTLGPATENAWSQRCYSKLAELTVHDIWQIADASDQQLQRLAHSDFP